MHDILTGGGDHWVYDQWLEIARQRFLGITPGGRVEWMALYHDPIADYTHRAGPTAGLSVAIYLLPQEPALAEILYRTAVDKIGWSDPARPVRSLPDPRFLLLGVVLAREFGDEITLARLTRYATDHFEPGFAGAGLQGSDEFGWGFGLDEPYPRGQLNGLLMMAEVGAPGAWSRVFTEPNLAKFDEPTVLGVDFPHLGIREARNAGGVLHIGSYAGTAAERGAPTSFRVTQLPDAASCVLRRDGVPYPRWRVLDPHTLQIDLDIDTHQFQLTWSTAPTAGNPDQARRAAAPGGTQGGTRPRPAAVSPAADRSTPTPTARTLTAGIPRPPCACC
jgi:hypothetical protein